MYKIKEITNKILQGNVLAELQKIPDNSIDTVITSPPYWGLRDYGEQTKIIWDGDENCKHQWNYRQFKQHSGRGDCQKSGKYSEQQSIPDKKLKDSVCLKCGAWYGQLGLEPTLDLFIQHLLQITKELYRILKPTGVLFWNHGDCYSGNSSYSSKEKTIKPYLDPKLPARKRAREVVNQSTIMSKCLCMQNYRLIIKMIDEQNWILRNNIIWNKPNHMPCSVQDRLSNVYEPVFMLVKNNKTQYYYNVKTGQMTDKKPKVLKEGTDWDWVIKQQLPEGLKPSDFNTEWEYRQYIRNGKQYNSKEPYKSNTPGCTPKKGKKISYWKSIDYWFDLEAIRVPHAQSSLDRIKQAQIHNEKFDPKRHKHEGKEQPGRKRSQSPFEILESIKDRGLPAGGKNPGDVWNICTHPYSEAHFAVFPEKLIEPMIKCGCPQWICPKCGKLRIRLTKTEQIVIRKFEDKGKVKEVLEAKDKRKVTPRSRTGVDTRAIHKTTGWSDCFCNCSWKPGIVLDPFMGSGTVGVVAKKLDRNFIGIELNKEYIKIAEKRIKKVSRPLSQFLRGKE